LLGSVYDHLEPDGVFVVDNGREMDVEGRESVALVEDVPTS
jgi:hypothetical protein